MSNLPIRYEKITVRLNSKHTHVVGYFKKSTRGKVAMERSLDLEPEDLSSDPGITNVTIFSK